MKIGALAGAASTPVETIRYYERAGLMPPPPRTDSNYRVYGTADVERLGFIRHCRSLDMTLDEIRVLLRYRDAPESDCGEVNALLRAHIGHVTARIRELRLLEKQLRHLAEQCQRSAASADCGILAELGRETAGLAPTVPSAPGFGHVHGSHRHEHGSPGKSGQR